MKVKPITPKEVVEKAKASFPSEVIEAFNELILEQWDGRQSIVHQSAVLARIVSKMSIDTDLSRRVLESKVIDKHYLDVEDFFRENGWYVEYDKPSIGDNYEAYYKFYPRETR